MIELIKEFLFGVSDTNVNQAIAPLALLALGGIAKGIAGFDWGGRRKAALASSRAAYNKQKGIYAGLDTSNPFSGLENRFSGADNQYDNMENTMEDMTVNTQQAQFEKQMFQQSQANTMQGLRGAAGSSGIAGLAQTMSNQAMTQSQRASASIGAQEAKNKLLTAQQAAQNDQLQRGEASRLDTASRTGAAAVDLQIAQGELGSMQMEQSKQATLLGMDAQALEGAQGAVTAGQQLLGEGIGDIVGGVGGAYRKTGPWDWSGNQ